MTEGNGELRPFLDRLFLRAVGLGFALFLSGCEGVQSVMSPASDGADKVLTLTLILFIGGAVIFAIVFAAAAISQLGSGALRAFLATNTSIAIGGIAFPIVVLSGLLIYGIVLMHDVSAAQEDPVEIEVTGRQWWWRVRYMTPEGPVETANEIHVPAGRPVRIALKSDDVIHSFWVPALAGKVDMIPGRTNTLNFTARETGMFRGQCAEYCGGPHALMAFRVVAQSPEDFDSWLAHQTRPADPPRTAEAEQGLNLFLIRGCGACHAIRGTDAGSHAGPDLTHVVSRAALAAETIVNNSGGLALWVSQAQTVKPNNHMPSFNELPPGELVAILNYLGGLK